MPIPEVLEAVIAEGIAVRSLEEGIFSVLPDRTHTHLYDGRAALYDMVVGSPLYNRVMWGASLAGYVDFAQHAAGSIATGILLDAGCGSLLFTARAYLVCPRSIVACDQSLHMLRRARSRLLKLAGHLPQHIVLLQADLNALPFRSSSFSTALCMNVLHHLPDLDGLMASFRQLLAPGGRLFLTSLVKSDRWIGNQYLDALFRRGDFVRPRSTEELGAALVDSFGQDALCWRKGSMAFGATRSAGDS